MKNHRPVDKVVLAKPPAAEGGSAPRAPRKSLLFAIARGLVGLVMAVLAQLFYLAAYLVVFSCVWVMVGATGLAKVLGAFVGSRTSALVALGAAMAGVGSVLFLTTGLWMTFAHGKWLSGDALAEFYRRNPGLVRDGIARAGGTTQLVWSDPISLRGLWRAARAGNLWRPPWRGRLARLVGLILMGLGALLWASTVAPQLALTLPLAFLAWHILLRCAQLTRRRPDN